MKATEPGQVISVDQLESTTLDFLAQLKGIFTTKCYKAATVFIDHFSNATFSYMQESLNAKQTLAATSAFKAWAREKGVLIKHYHANNGRQAEKCMRDIQESARKNLLHGQARWLESRLQKRQAYPKWDSRARLGMNLGPSPVH
eukprot:1507774-Ditylum_brightwellii.AAC.1